MRFAFKLILVLWLMAANPANADDFSGKFQKISDFTQKFYDWYLPIVKNSKIDTPWIYAIRMRPKLFSRILSEQLERDAEAQNRNAGEIVSLDFDPFLDSQDPEDGYVVKGVKTEKTDFQVDVYGKTGGIISSGPEVVVCIVELNGRYVISNFIYPEGGNLLNVLKLLASDRNGRK